MPREKSASEPGNEAKEGIFDGINKGINRAPLLFLHQRETERSSAAHQPPPPPIFDITMNVCNYPF